MHKEWKCFDKLKHPTIICCNAGVESLIPSETNFGLSFNLSLGKILRSFSFFDFRFATLSNPCYTYYGQNNRLHTFTIPLEFSHCRNGVWHGAYSDYSHVDHSSFFKEATCNPHSIGPSSSQRWESILWSQMQQFFWKRCLMAFPAACLCMNTIFRPEFAGRVCQCSDSCK